MSIAMFGFAAASYFDRTTFLYITFATRFLQGFSSSAIQTTVFSATGQLFGENQAKAIAWMEIACGFGLAVAPTLGKIMYHHYDYAGPFYLIGSFFVIFALVCKFVIPAEMDKRLGDVTVNEEEMEEMPRAQGSTANEMESLRETYQQENAASDAFSTSSDEAQRPSLMRILMKPAVFMGCFTGALGFLTYSQQEPLLANRIEPFGYSTFQSGLFFALNPIAYLIAGVGTQFQPRHVDLRVFIIMGATINAAAMFLNGPSKIFGLPE